VLWFVRWYEDDRSSERRRYFDTNSRVDLRVRQTRRTTRTHDLRGLFRVVRSSRTLQGRSIFEDSSGSLLRDGDDFDEGAAGFRRWLRPSDIAVVLNRTATATKGDGGGVRLDLDIRRLEDKRWAQYTFR